LYLDVVFLSSVAFVQVARIREFLINFRVIRTIRFRVATLVSSVIRVIRSTMVIGVYQNCSQRRIF
jgi:hypothetical protein